MKEQLRYAENLMPLLSWIHLIDVHQNVVFGMEKNCWRARVTDNRCNNDLLTENEAKLKFDFFSC